MRYIFWINKMKCIPREIHYQPKRPEMYQILQMRPRNQNHLRYIYGEKLMKCISVRIHFKEKQLLLYLIPISQIPIHSRVHSFEKTKKDNQSFLGSVIFIKKEGNLNCLLSFFPLRYPWVDPGKGFLYKTIIS